MTGLRDRLGLVRARLWPGAGRFLEWWGQGLAAWLPTNMRRALGVGRGRLLLQVAADGIVLSRQQDDGLHELGRIPAQPVTVTTPGTPAFGTEADTSIDPLARLLAPRIAELPRWLMLPASSCLRRRLVLPAAAADRLRDVVGFEVDRQTPFDVANVIYDARVLGRRERDGQLDVELVVVPRTALAPQIADLGALADGLAGIDVAAEGGMPIGVNLLPPEQRRQQRDPWMLWNWGLAVFALFACGLMLWQVLQNRSFAADRFEARIAEQAAAGREAAEKRQRLLSLIEGQAFLDKTRAERPVSVEVIDELTRRLPDNTYLEKLSLEEQRMMLIGLSSEAPGLISRLQGAPYWRSPALAGALQPDPTSGRDRFTLTAELANAAPARAAAPAATPTPADTLPPAPGKGEPVARPAPPPIEPPPPVQQEADDGAR